MRTTRLPALIIRDSAALCRCQLDGLMPLEPPRRALNLVEPIDLDIKLEILTQLLNFKAVPLDRLDRLRRMRPVPDKQTVALTLAAGSNSFIN